MLFLVVEHPWTVLNQLIFVALIAALAYQLKMVLPYTFIWKKQVKQVKQDQLDPQRQISLIVSNVLTTNTQYHRLIEQIQTHQPDLVLTLETDQTWQNELSVIEADYPYRVPVPLDNLYGMHLYSKLELRNTQVKFILSDEIPSIHTTVILGSGQPVQLHCLHPKPPSPTEAKDSTLRDAELLIVGDQIILDPRVGRHYVNTFHADYPFFRWSLDHVFHSTDFALVHMERLPHIGSDHFPVFLVLQTGRVFEHIQEELEQTDEDEQEAQEAIEEGIQDCLHQFALLADGQS